MALFRTLKRAFGFSDSEMEEEELEGIDARVTPLRQRLEGNEVAELHEDIRVANVNASLPKDANARQSEINDSEEAAMSGMALPTSAIFESVVKIFNDSLPDFLKATVDAQAQCDYLYQSLDSAVKQYIESVEIDAQRRCNIKWENERKSMQMQMEALRLKSQKDEEECSGSKKLQLSAERQKRALTERVHDLEKQLATLEAENEQFILENKSLVNKLRLNSVMSPDGTGITDDTLVAKNAELTTEIEKLQSQYQSAVDEKSALAQKLEAFTAEKDALKVEIKRLNDALEQSRVKDNLGDAMLTELHEKAAVAEEKLQKKEQEALTLTERLESATKENGLLQKECSTLKMEKESQAEKLREALENLSVVEKMQTQLAALEESRRANDAFVRKQQDEIMQKEEQIRHLESEKADYAETVAKKDDAIRALEDIADSLRKTIENNLYEHAQTQSALRSEIDRLKAFSSLAGETAADYSPLDKPLQSDEADLTIESPTERPHRNKAASKKSKLKISAIDETLEDTDWLIATPPPTKKKELEENAAEEFGYKEPVRKITPDNPAQMSLW